MYRHHRMLGAVPWVWCINETSNDRYDCGGLIGAGDLGVECDQQEACSSDNHHGGAW